MLENAANRKDPEQKHPTFINSIPKLNLELSIRHKIPKNVKSPTRIPIIGSFTSESTSDSTINENRPCQQLCKTLDLNRECKGANIGETFLGLGFEALGSRRRDALLELWSLFK